MARGPRIPSARRTVSTFTAVVVGALFALACGGGEEAAEKVVAEVGDEEITVEEAAEYMMRTGRGANREAVERAVENLVDLRLVEMRAREQHEFSAQESLQMREWREILLINQFREDVVWQDVEVDEEKLREWYEENVGEERKVRHILISVDPTAPEEEKAEARALADSLHQAIEEGADMAELAAEYSEDAGSAQQGGLLGWTGRGQWVEPFEEAAFSTPEGELAPVVESQFGYHVLRVEETRKRSFDELREEIEQQVMSPERSEAEQAFVTELMETSGIEFHEDNVDRFIAMVRSETARQPTDEERQLPLATYSDDGVITLGELWGIYTALPQGNQRAIQRLDQAGMIQALSSLVQQRLLLERAKTADVELDSVRQQQLSERIDQLYIEAYLRDAAQAQLDVPDSLVRIYYDEHREFYRGQSLDEVREQIRTVLQSQRMQAMQAPDAQMKLVEAIADSQATDARVEVHEDTFDDVLEVLRAKYEEQGTEPPAQTPQAPTAAPPAGTVPQGAPPTGAAPQGTPAGPPPGATPPPPSDAGQPTPVGEDDGAGS
ncbi:MAG: peptidylprolyl isomerase [Gemmatimonadota bacterium]|nr:peptidylprolyl isomerase [Gemmatimonadota bacterium]